MPLIDRYVPIAHFRERHALDVAAAPNRVLGAAGSYRTESDPFFKRMIGLRELPMRLSRIVSRRHGEARAPFGIDTFTVLEQQDDEIVYGLAGRFWRSDFDLRPLKNGADFLSLNEPGIAKLALNFAVRPNGKGGSSLSTETRVFCVDTGARLRFAPYWYLIRPVSGLIRRRTLTSIRRTSESAAPIAAAQAERLAS